MKTQCNKCIFGNSVSSNKACEFNISSEILEHKEISIIDDYYVINNYNCLYGFSKNQYESNKNNLEDINLKQIIENRASLKYYLLLDARNTSTNELVNLINIINSYSIKPKKLSILIDPDRSDYLYKLIKNNLSCDKWTIHVFLASLSFNDCINIILDTNLSTCDAWCVIFYDGSKYNNNLNQTMDLQNITSYLHKKIIIHQSTGLGFINSLESLHGMCLNCSLYKYLTSVVSNNILKAISITSDISLQTYEKY